MAIFDNKNFNAQVFGQYIDRIPNLTRNRMIKSGAIRMRNDLATALKDDVGGNFLSTPLLGLVNGDPVNYDGNTNITVSSTTPICMTVLLSVVQRDSKRRISPMISPAV